MDRRDVLRSIAGGLAAATIGDLTTAYGAERGGKSKLGVAQFSYSALLRADRAAKSKKRLSDPLNFIDRLTLIRFGV